MSYHISISEKIQKLRDYQYDAAARNEIREHLNKALEALDYDTPELLLLINQFQREIKELFNLKDPHTYISTK